MRLVSISGPALSFTGLTTTSGQPVVSGFSDASKIQVGAMVAGQCVPSGTLVSAVASGQITLSQPATLTSSAATLQIGYEPITLAEAKLHLRLQYPDDDPLIASLIVTARRYCENLQRVAYLPQTWKLLLDSFPSAGGYYNRAIREVWPSLGGLPSGLGFYPGMVPNSTGVIDLPKPPILSVVAAQYYDFGGALQTVSPSTYTVSLGTPGRIQPAYSKVWPISRPTIDSVQITFTSGMASDPSGVSENVKTAMKMLVHYWYYNRDSTSGAGSAVVVNRAMDDTIAALLSTDDPGVYA